MLQLFESGQCCYLQLLRPICHKFYVVYKFSKVAVHIGAGTILGI